MRTKTAKQREANLQDLVEAAEEDQSSSEQNRGPLTKCSMSLDLPPDLDLILTEK